MAKRNFSDPKALDGVLQDSTGSDIPSGVTKVDAPKASSSTIKEIDVPKAAINTTKAAEAVAAGSGSTGVAATYSRGSVGVVFSGGAGAIAGDLSATVKGVNQYGSRDRTGRRADPITRKIDLLNAEIVEEQITQSKPLSETDAKQGYPGNYHNQHARAQKANGSTPADPMFMRSMDEISMDMIYYPAGQQLPFSGFDDYEIHSYDVAGEQYSDDAVDIESGNYVGRYLEFDVAAAGITNFQISVDDITPTQALDEPTYRAASDALLRNINSAELDRARIIEESGNENLDGWSPLGLAIPYSSDQIRFLREFEASVGDLVQLSRRKLATALSYQINKTAKDGSRLSGPIAEMCNGLVSNDTSIGEANPIGNVDFYAGDGWHATFGNPEVLRKGSAALYVAMNDSTPKYNTKGKFLTLPLSFRAALTAAKANANPLRTHNNLEAMLAKNELFSTIDGPYDGVKPVVVTNGAALALPVNVYQLGNGTGNANHKFPIYTMHFENLRNRYNISINNYFLAGIYRYLNERRSNILRALGDAEKHVKIPIVSSTTSVSLWDLIVCASVPHIVDERIVTMSVILQYEKQHGYPFTNSVDVGQVEVCKAENFSFTSEDEMLVSAIAKPVPSMKVIMPEIFWPVAKMHCEIEGVSDKAISAKTVLPHYFVQNQFREVFHHGDPEKVADSAHTLVLSDDFGSMAYPSTRAGSRFGYLDTIYGMSEEDYRLSLDRMVTWPGAMRVTSTYAGPIAGYDRTDGKFQTMPFTVYKYGMTADGQPVIPYVAYTEKPENKGYALTIMDILSTPRELGLMQVAPAGYLTPVRRANGVGAHTLESTAAYLGTSGPGFKFKIYRAEGTVIANDQEYLNDGATAIGIENSLRGIWHEFSCIPSEANFDQGWVFNASTGYNNTFVPFTLNGMDAVEYAWENGVYNNPETAVGDMPIHAPHKYYWARMQRMPFAINPMDANAADLTTATGELTMVNDVDIFDFLYTLGLCGFRCSDYMELIYDRSKEKVTLGMNYVDDPFVGKTMLLK